MPDTRAPKQIYKQQMQGVDPRMRWMDGMTTDLDQLGYQEWKDSVTDRKKWKSMVFAAKSQWLTKLIDIIRRMSTYYDLTQQIKLLLFSTVSLVYCIR